MPPQHGDHIGDDEGGRGPADEQRGDEGHSRHEAQHPARGVRGRSPPRPGTGGAGRAGGRGGGGAGSVTEPVKSQSGWDKAQRRGHTHTHWAIPFSPTHRSSLSSTHAPGYFSSQAQHTQGCLLHTHCVSPPTLSPLTCRQAHRSIHSHSQA